VPTRGEGRAFTEVTGVGLKESLGAGTCDEAGAKVGVEKSTADKVCSVEGEGGARGSGVGDRRETSGVFEGEEGVRKVGEVSQTRSRIDLRSLFLVFGIILAKHIIILVH
jgi:hypothetical protein